MDGIWIRKPIQDTSVVFVHGFLSDGEACWTHESGAYWPILVKDEPGLESLGIYVYTYQTDFFSGSYSLSDVVDDIKERMRVDGVFASKRIIFVCHSMGGIVVRKFLVERVLDLFLGEHEIGLFLLASPSLGSDYADWLKPLAEFLGHNQARALGFVRNNLWLDGLNKEFKNIKEAGKLQLKGRELIEDKFVILPKFFGKQVVEPFAGAVWFGDPYKVPKSDHFSIAKPSSSVAIQHRLLVAFAKKSFPGVIPPCPAAGDAVPSIRVDPPLISDAETMPSKPRNLAEESVKSHSALVLDLCSKDPLIAMPASRALSAILENTISIIDRPHRSNELVPLTAAKFALSGKRDAAKELTARVLTGDADWHRASAAAHDLDSSHRNFCAAQLGNAFNESGRDGQRIIFWALGNLGAVDWAWTLYRFYEKLDADEASSYSGIALQSFADMLQFAHGRDDVMTASAILMRALLLDHERESNGYSALSLRLVLGRCRSGAHIDRFLTDWTSSDSALIREIGADALGDAGVHRSIPVLERLLDDRVPSVRNAASLALGAIGSTEALGALLRSAPDSHGVALSVHLVNDDREFRTRAIDLLSLSTPFGWAVIRAIGLRGMADLATEIRPFVHSASDVERGCSLLALARLGHPSDRARIEIGFNESSDSPFEKTMAALGMLVSVPTSYSEISEALRVALGEMSYAFWKPAQQDIITILESLDIAEAKAVARAWKPFYPGFR